MNYKCFKTVTPIFLVSAMLILSGCGDDGYDEIAYVPPIQQEPEENTSVDTSPKPGELGYQTILPNGDIEYVDYTGGTRISKPSAAAAEYHTGVNFGNTLFDSAEKKCQNCHNELYDTWKNSMHGKSWSEPVFQANMQDFLRSELSKIGSEGPNIPANGTAITYTESLFSKSALTCVKCHAPGAYYAGDVKISVSEVNATLPLSTAELATLKTQLEKTDPSGEIAVIAASSSTQKIYKATFQIGHEANREGINCAFCHSIETPRLMKADGMDGGIYTLAQDMRNGVHGSIVLPKGTELLYNVDATSLDMNAFFKLVGPEKYTAFHATPKENFDIDKTADGRFTMTSKDINGTDGKVHFTGGPFYGPYGVTGTTNENETDETNRLAQVNPHFDKDGNNHFGESGKGLCLSCHQRSAGPLAPNTGNTRFMELCSTTMAVSSGETNTHEDTITSPKCQKCHMERIEGTVLHQWARPDKLFTLADNPALTSHFDPADPEGLGDENPIVGKWLNSHAFLGASKVGHDAASAKAKIQSGFDATLDTAVTEDTLTVTTTFTNKTAHMLPGAHPMRRMLTRVIVTDDEDNKIDVESSRGASTFAAIENNVQPLQGKTLHSSAFSPVEVQENGSREMTFPGKVPDFAEEGNTTVSQDFNETVVRITATTNLADQNVSASGTTTGNTPYATIINSPVKTDFTRIYGRQTTKNISSQFVVRPGFDSHIVNMDNRLSPNETETYTVNYTIDPNKTYTVTYKVYYMQKGANGQFPDTPEGWLDETVNAAKKLLITEVYSDTKTVN